MNQSKLVQLQIYTKPIFINLKKVRNVYLVIEKASTTVNYCDKFVSGINL